MLKSNVKKEENLFWFYRGQRDSEEFNDTQLENNFTKALFIVLINCEHFRSDFLSEFLKVSNKGEIRFEMQKTIPVDFDSANKPVLFILTEELKKHGVKKTKKQKSVPDGWIITNNQNILVEVKITGNITEDQLRRHEKKLGKKSRRIYRTWDELAIFLKDQLAKTQNEVEGFLLEQFVVFLEVEGMTKFSGFNESDLNFFKSKKNTTHETRNALRRKFTNFKEAVTKNQKLSKHLKPGEVGVLKKYAESIWFPIPLKKTPYFNISVVLELEELSVSLSSPTHRTSDGIKFVTNLNDRQRNIVKFFKKHPDLVVTLFKREQGAEKENWKRYDLWKRVQTISAEMMSKGLVDMADLRKQFEKIDGGALGKSKAGINIKYSIPRAELMHMDASRTVTATIGGIKLMDQLARKIIGK